MQSHLSLLVQFEISTSESHTWQKGLEAKADVPQYLLYNVIWNVLGKTTTKKKQVQ